MGDLIKVSQEKIGVEEVQSVSARELYLGLGLDKSNWARWSGQNIVGSDFFTENVDWARFVMMTNPTNGLPVEDFAVTLDFGKHIAMMAKTVKGHEYRNYFLNCEKELRNPKIGNQEQALKLSQYSVDAARAFGLIGNQAYLSADKAIKAITGVSVLALLGTELVAPVQAALLTPTDIAERLGIKKLDANKLLTRLGLQTNHRDHKNVLYYELTEEGLKFGEYQDTGKKHSDGTPVKQLKWNSTVLGFIGELQ